MSNLSVVYTARTSYIRCNDDDVCFVLHQHAWLDLYSANSSKQQSVVRHISPLRSETLFWFRSNPSYLLLLNDV